MSRAGAEPNPDGLADRVAAVVTAQASWRALAGAVRRLPRPTATCCCSSPGAS